MKTLKVLSFAAGLALMLTGCSGPTGPQGPAGANGANGANGVANINIQEFQVNTSAWSYDAVNGYWYTPTVSDGAITDPTAEAVIVSFSLNSAGSWQPIPVSHALINGDQLTYGWTTNSIAFFYDESNVNPPSVTLYFNVAVIPPAVMKKHPGMNWKDTKAVLALPEVEAAMQAFKDAHSASVYKN